MKVDAMGGVYGDQIYPKMKSRGAAAGGPKCVRPE